MGREEDHKTVIGELEDLFFSFPAGEVHCKLYETVFNRDLGMNSPVYLPKLVSESINDWLMRNFMALDVIRQYQTTLVLPYLPYSRQDRPTSAHEPFSLRVIGNLLRSFKNLKRVVTLDVHSDVAYGCIEDLVNIDIVTIMKTLGFDKSHKHCTLVVPDQGANKKLKDAPFQKKVILIKERNTDTGHVEIKSLDGDVEGDDVIIFDDICDGGRTFTEAARVLYDAGANSVQLFVTHGIFSKGIEPLLDSGITYIYTTDSLPQETHFQKTVHDVRKIYHANGYAIR